MKKISTLFAVVLPIMFLILSSTSTQALVYSSTGTQTSSDDTSYFIEEMNVIAGIDSAALVKLHLFGGITPLKVSSSEFDDVLSWALIFSDQGNYADYLLRRPFRSPDNATLLLELDESLGTDGSLNQSLRIAQLFDEHYNLELHWAGAAATEDGNYLYVFSSGSGNEQIELLTDEIKGDVTSGYAAAIDTTDVSSSPVKAVFIGEEFRSATYFRGIYYVEPEAITEVDGEYTLSTDNLFGADLGVYEEFGVLKYSVLKFRFPYLINALSISPTTDNVAPQISGKMDWIMQVPWRLRDLTGNFEVVYTMNQAELASSPRVSVNMDYDQELLNQEGILQMNYEVTNTGTETANNITISYPLGPDFIDMIVNSPVIYKLRDDVTIDEDFYSEVNATLLIDFGGSLDGIVEDFYVNTTVLVFDGWYRNITDGELAFWNESSTEEIVNFDYQSFDTTSLGIPGTGSITVNATLKSDEGLNTIMTYLVQYYLSLVDLTNYILAGDLDGLINDYGEALWTGIAYAVAAIQATLYEEQTLFDPNLQDFEYIERTVGPVGAERTEYFLEAVIPSLAPGETVNLSWALENVTSANMEFGVMRAEEIVDSDAIKLVTEKHNYLEMMQMILGFADDAGQLAYGRPISYYDDEADAWLSVGARFRYTDPEGFEYYGFSNGINFQLADDEAVLNTHVELNQTSYKVGEPVTITGYIRNTGNINAENVKLYLFHGRMGNDWQIEDPDLFYYEEVGTIQNGTEYNFEVQVNANSFLGIHPVYAVVEFDSDYGQDELPVYNFWYPDQTEEFEGAAQTHEWVLSNMDWALLIPNTNERRPAFPQPVLDIETEVNIIIPDNAPWEIEITLTITNIGDAETHITITQYYNQSELSLLSKSTSKGSIANGTYFGMGYIRVEGITLYPGDSVTLTMHWLFLTSDGCYIPAAEIIYDSRFENELGGDEEGGLDSVNAFRALDGTSQESETSNWEDYGASTSTGSSAGADIYTGGQNKTRRVGSMDLLYISAITLLIPIVFLKKRKRN